MPVKKSTAAKKPKKKVTRKKSMAARAKKKTTKKKAVKKTASAEVVKKIASTERDMSKAPASKDAKKSSVDADIEELFGDDASADIAPEESAAPEKEVEDDASEQDRDFVLTELPDESNDEEIEEISESEKPKKKKKEKKLSRKDKKKMATAQEMTKEDEKNIDDRLTEIYENTDGSMPDMKTFQKKKRNAFLKAFYVLLTSIVLFAIVAWIGLFVIQPRTSFSEDDVVLTITGNEEVAPGEEVTYRVRYRNAQGVDLNDARLELRYPAGFQFVTSTIASDNEDNDVWDLTRIDAQGGGYIDITGRMYGDKMAEQSFRAFLNYMPENFSSEFQKVGSLTVTITKDIATLEIIVPEEIPMGGEVPVEVAITPVDDAELTNVRVECAGDEFTVGENSQPEREDVESCAWTFSSITEPQKISFAGSFQGEEETTLTLSLRGFAEEDMSDEGFVIASESITVTPVKTATSVSLAVNGSVADSSIAPGEDIIASLVVKNNGEAVMENVQINLVYEAPSYQNRSMLAWTAIDLSHEADIYGEQVNDAVRRGIVTWDSRYIAELASLKPGEEVVFDVTLPVKNGAETTLANFESGEIVLSGNVLYTLAAEEKKHDISPITLTLVSDVNLEVVDDISEDVEGNAVHTVTWLLSNSYHDLVNITLDADIYGNVVVREEDMIVPAGEVVYDADTKRITWKIDEMPTSVDVLGLQFDIVMLSDNPTQTQLTSQVKGRATDSVLDSKVLFVGSAIGL